MADAIKRGQVDRREGLSRASASDENFGPNPLSAAFESMPSLLARRCWKRHAARFQTM